MPSDHDWWFYHPKQKHPPLNILSGIWSKHHVTKTTQGWGSHLAVNSISSEWFHHTLPETRPLVGFARPLIPTFSLISNRSSSHIFNTNTIIFILSANRQNQQTKQNCSFSLTEPRFPNYWLLPLSFHSETEVYPRLRSKIHIWVYVHN